VTGSYAAALEDWMACAVGGAGARAARAARAAADGAEGRVAALGTAGHVLDYDDTYPPGLAHLSAAVAPAALVVGAARGARVGDVLAAFAAGVEAMGGLARAAHPALYEGGWHPTAVCGGAGAAVAAAHLLGLDAAQQRSAAGLALLRAGGLRAAFGTDGKALQVGLAAAGGVAAARLAAAGAAAALERVLDGPAGWAEAFGVVPGAAAGALAPGDPRPGAPCDGPGAGGEPAIARTWIKAWPCCLQTHGAIEAALALRARDGTPRAGAITVVVHPVSRRAAALDDVADGLEAKFSIPYLTAFALARGGPRVADFAAVDPAVRALARARVGVRTDPSLLESEARLEVDGTEVERVLAATGSPGRPLTPEAVRAKRAELGADGLAGALDDPERPAAELVGALEASVS
jgi:2-methylcitrate dehydratase PrpD